MDPIEVDMGEGMKTWRVLPGYAWARDGKSIVIAQGGKIRRVDVASGHASTRFRSPRASSGRCPRWRQDVDVPTAPSA